MSVSLDTIPFEILQHVAYFAATNELVGPPTDLTALSQASRAFYRAFSFTHNPTLYAVLFPFKFDIAAPIRRLGHHVTTTPYAAKEFRSRFEALKRFRVGQGSQALLGDSSTQENDLWVSLLMMLENDGKNALQLKVYGRIIPWMQNFFLDQEGGSYAKHDMIFNNWPRDSLVNKLAVWLICLCDSETETDDPDSSFDDIIRVYSVNALKYPLTGHPWFDITLPCNNNVQKDICHFGENHIMTPPSIAIPAIMGHISHLPPMIARIVNQSNPHTRAPEFGTVLSRRWELDWYRCNFCHYRIQRSGPEPSLVRTFHIPGSFDGAWGGIFTYAEFGVYAAILSGESPQTIHDGAIGQNHQIWRLREYDLFFSDADFPIVRYGSPQNAFFPMEAVLEENDDHVSVREANQTTRYRRATCSGKIPDISQLRDVLLLGEGHSSWGDFRLKGRIRPGDGLFTIMKEYEGPDDRGRWLYRGYLFGGKFVGRWRDTMTPMTMIGYEGSFEMVVRR